MRKSSKSGQGQCLKMTRETQRCEGRYGVGDAGELDRERLGDKSSRIDRVCNRYSIVALVGKEGVIRGIVFVTV